MKLFFKVLLPVVFVFLGFKHVNASHVSGADITYQCIGADSFLVQLNIFRDCSGISITETTQNIAITSSCSSQTGVLSIINPGGSEISQLCSADSTNSTCFTGGTLPGMQVYTYEGIVVLPPCTDYIFSWSLCCRNTSLTFGSSTPTFYVQATMNSINQPCNTSPSFTAQPIPYVCAGQQVSYNFGVTESDGDSIYYQFVSAQDGVGSPIAYAGTYTPSQPIPGITLDPVTGLLLFTPAMLGNVVVVVEVQEFDNQGNLLGSVIRDIQFIVQTCNNNVPSDTTGVVQNLTGTATQLDNYSIILCDGGTFSFDIVISDPDNDSITLTSNIAQVLPGATFTATHGSPATATISWTATGGNNFNNSFVVVADDDVCPIPGQQTYVYNIQVQQSTVASENVVVICGQQVANLSVQGGNTFTWTALAGGDTLNVGVNFECDTCANTWANPTTTTSYQVVSDLTTIGCVNTDTVLVQVVPDFGYIKTQTDTNVCLSETVLFSVAPDTVGTISYQWSPAAFFNIGDTTNSVQGTISSPGITPVIFTASSTWGCVKTDTFLVTASQNIPPIMSITGDSTVCLGDSIKLQVVNTIPYSCDYTLEMFDSFGDGWNGASFDIYLNGVLDTSITLDSGGSGVATFSVSNVDSIEVIYIPGAWEIEVSYIFYDGEGNILLQNGSFPPTGSIYNAAVNCGINNTLALTYSWSPAIWVSQNGINNPWVTPLADTTLMVITTDTIGGCTDTSSLNIYVASAFTTTLYQSDTVICLYESVEMSVTPPSNTTYTYLWLNNSYLSSTIDSVAVADTIASSGMLTYYVETSNFVGCTKLDSFKILVSDGPSPIITVNGDSTVCEGDTTNLIALFSPNSNKTCEYCIDLYDNFGDGWNGSFLSLWLNDTLAQDSLFSQSPWGAGPFGQYCFNASEGTKIELKFTSAVLTNSNHECSYYLINGSDTIFSDGLNDTDPIIGSAFIGLTNCGSTVSSSLVYSWLPSVTLGSPDSVSTNAYPLVNTTYTVMVVDSIGGCGDTATYNVMVVPNFEPTAIAVDTAICLFENATFSISTTPAANSNYTYNWGASPYLTTNTGITNTTSNITEFGYVTFVYTVSSPEGCGKEGVASVFVSAGIKPNIIAVDKIICEGTSTPLDPPLAGLNLTGDSCQLTIVLSDPVGNGWNGAVLAITTGGTTDSLTFVTGADTTIFLMVGVTDSICINHTNGLFPGGESYSITNQDNNVLFADGFTVDGLAPTPGNVWCSRYVCGLNDATYTYAWTPSNTLTSTDTKYTVASPSVTTTYQLIVTDTIGACADTANITVNIQTIPRPHIAVPGAACAGDTAFVLQDFVLDGSTGSWSGTPITNPTSGIFNPANGTIGANAIVYSVTQNGCTGDTTVNIIIKLTPNAPVTSANNPYCMGSSLSGITAIGNGTIFTWYQNDKITEINTGTSPDLGVALASDTLFVAENLNGCIGSLSSVAIDVVSIPQVGFTATPDNGLIPLDVTFTNTSDDLLNYNWNFGNWTGSTEQDPSVVTYPNTGNFTVILVGTDANGCQSKDSLIIKVTDETYVPIVFSPNGDGNNDVFKVKGFPAENFECFIYNRWGVKVHEFFDVSKSWDGANQPDGTYFVVINYTDWDGQQKNYSIALTLITGRN